MFINLTYCFIKNILRALNWWLEWSHNKVIVRELAVGEYVVYFLKNNNVFIVISYNFGLNQFKSDIFLKFCAESFSGYNFEFIIHNSRVQFSLPHIYIFNKDT